MISTAVLGSYGNAGLVGILIAVLSRTGGLIWAHQLHGWYVGQCRGRLRGRPVASWGLSGRKDRRRGACPNLQQALLRSQGDAPLTDAIGFDPAATATLWTRLLIRCEHRVHVLGDFVDDGGLRGLRVMASFTAAINQRSGARQEGPVRTSVSPAEKRYFNGLIFNAL